MKIGILTGGGDCPGLNPAIRGFVMKALDYGYEVYAIREGWRGLVKGIVDEKPLTVADVEEIISWGGTMLRSSRTNPYKDPAQLEAVKANIKKYGFDCIVALGGEDTLGVASRLYHDGIVNTVGIPKTMDNDLSETDYTFGFDTSVGVDTDAVDRLRDTARSHMRIVVLEVMGRHAGWVALYTGIAGGADWILLPEIPLDLEAMCAHLKESYARKRYGIVVASEGVELPGLDEQELEVLRYIVDHALVSVSDVVAQLAEPQNLALDVVQTVMERLCDKDYLIRTQKQGTLHYSLPDPKTDPLRESKPKLDAFGHPILGDRNVGEFIAKEIEKRTGIETRAAATGHIQRGGPPSAFDRVLATRVGIHAAECVHKGDFGKMTAIHGTEVVAVPIEKAVGTLKTVPVELYKTLTTLFSK